MESKAQKGLKAGARLGWAERVQAMLVTDGDDEAETATSKSVRAQACAPLLCPLPGELRMTGALALGWSRWPWPHCRAGTPTGCTGGKAHQAWSLRGWGLLWLCRGDSDTGTLVGWEVHTEEPPHLLSGISAPQSQPYRAVLLSFCVPPQGLCSGGSTSCTSAHGCPHPSSLHSRSQHHSVL